MSPRRRATALALLLGLLAVSCDPAGEPDGPARPVPGGELVVAVRDLGTFDPARASGRGALLVVAQVFDSLTAIDPRTGKVVPAAAESWKASSSGLRWTITLRKATFHDGSPVLAQHFKFAFDRLTRKSTRSDAAFQLEQVRGFRRTHTEGTARTLSGVRARGDRTLEITLDRPFAELPYVLAHPALAPLRERSTKTLRSAPVGNGPFRVVQATPEESAVLEPFADYTPSPYVDRVRLVVTSSIDEGWSMFLRDEVHLADVPISAIATARGEYGATGFTSQWSTLSYGPNFSRAAYKKREVRRAISLAIDREAIASTIYGGTKDPATGVLPRGIRGFVPDACSVCVRDLDRARQIMRAAFGSRRPTMTIDHLSDQASRQVSRAIANQLQEIGFRVRLRAHSPDDYLELLQDGEHDFAQLGWLSDVPTPDGFLAQQLRTGSPNNQTGYKDASFDRLIDLARRSVNEENRLGAYRRAEARALELMPLIPVVFFRNRTAVAERAHGVVVDGAGLFDASKVWLEP